MRIVMMGTGVFALATFKALLESEHEVVGLFTQPDRTGRGHHHHVNPMKVLADENGVPVFQPVKARAPESVAELKALNADLGVVAAYGQILSEEFLSAPRLGAINLHASLLPKYRGAAPIQWAVINGEEVTGVTIFQIVQKLDAGPVWGMFDTPIKPEETYGELQDRLADLSVPLTLQVLEEIAAGKTQPEPQDDHLATLAPRLQKKDGEIDWTKSASLVESHIRGVQPWPKPTSTLHITGRKPLPVQIPKISLEPAEEISGTPGEIVTCDKEQMLVQTGEGVVSVLQIQPSGKKLMEIEAFLRGYQPQTGDRFE